MTNKSCSRLTGAMLESHPAEGETPAFQGSMMLAVAENEAEVRAILENDIYAHSGVWDLAKAQIIPVRYILLSSFSLFHFLSMRGWVDGSGCGVFIE